jgi:hypothetical protein
MSMASKTLDALKQEALELFGKDLSDDELELCKGRLPTMIQNVRLLAEWSKRLDEVPPAQVQRPVMSPVMSKEKSGAKTDG